MTAPPPEHPATPTTPTTPGAPAAYAGRILALLTVANVLNFYDRAIPAVVVEPVRQEFGLTDSQVGVLSSAFIVVYAIAGVLLGRLADAGSRRKVMAAGLLLWSVFTALSGGAWSFASLLLFRLGVGIGEASYAPSANALIFDTWPTHRRARAVSIFQIALPVGLLLAYLTVGPIVERTGSWRWPFVVAAVPGLGLAILLWFMPEPPHIGQVASERIAQPLRHLIRIRTLRWLILAGIGTQIANYAGATFLVPLLQRWFGMPLSRASLGAGLVLGAAGLLAYPRLACSWTGRHGIRCVAGLSWAPRAPPSPCPWPGLPCSSRPAAARSSWPGLRPGGSPGPSWGSRCLRRSPMSCPPRCAPPRWRSIWEPPICWVVPWGRCWRVGYRID